MDNTQKPKITHYTINDGDTKSRVRQIISAKSPQKEDYAGRQASATSMDAQAATARNKQGATPLYKKPWFWVIFALTFIPLWWVWIIFAIVMICVNKRTQDFCKRLLKKTPEFLKSHKRLAIGATVAVVGVIASINIVNVITQSIEEGRDYYINIAEEITFDCEATDSGNGWAYCKEQLITGSFSNYSTVEFEWRPDITTSGNDFTDRISDRISSSLYELDDFSVEKLPEGFDEHEYLGLRNTVLDKKVASKTITIHYKFTDADIELITKLHDDWVKEEHAAEIEQAECEAKGYWYREHQCKSQEEWGTEYKWRDAQQACKRYGWNGYAKTLTDCYIGDDYKGPVEEKVEESTSQKSNENTEKKSESKQTQEQTQSQTQEQSKTQDNGEELPSDISPYDIKALCERGFENAGYPNASISMTNQYPMGYPPYIYVIVGQLSYKKGWTSSRVNVGTIQCQANWSTWSIKHLTVNGQQIY